MEQITKVLIIGSKGMAGHMLYHYFKENTNFELIDIARGNTSHTPSYQLDISDFNSLVEILTNERPNVVINCIGILNKDAEDHPDKAILMNSYFPHFLAKNGTKLDYKLIHISTDCVFNGKKGSYNENSIKDGEGFYAQTKALGEVLYGNHLTFRTSIIGPELNANGIGLFHWVMQQMGEIKGYSAAYWTGVTTLELAKAIVVAIEQNIQGLHHLVNGEKINKYDLTSLFKEIFALKHIQITPYDLYKIDKSLVKSKFDFEYQVPSYYDMVAQMKEWIIGHADLYAHYGG